MNNIRIINICFITLTIGFFGCSNQKVNENVADYGLAKEFEIDSMNLKYQYYQKYGFTDICEDIQMISEPNSNPNYKNNLPINTDDLETLKSKFNRLNDSTITLKRNSRHLYQDIELDFSEYYSDTNLNFRIKHGKYEVSESEFETTLRIYDEESGLVYLGIKQCDGR